MKKYKVCVYAICKNEEKFVDRWVESMKEADGIYVLDTGSTDNTVEKLKKLGVNVSKKIIKPWRFDVARNESIKLIPEDCDICVCTDLDEVFKPGWRKELEKCWKNNTTRLRYIYNWSLDEFDNPIISFYYEKIHARHGFKWVLPVHEILEYDGEEIYSISDNIILNHYPDSKKSRSSYLPLLELSIKENPNNDRTMHYLGREYMYYHRYNDAIDTLIKHINMESATWKDERCASMRFIGRCYKMLNRFNESRMWFQLAIKEAPYLRDPYVEMALLEYQLGNYSKVIFYCQEALQIKSHTKSYINEPFSWDHTIYDLISIAYFYKNDYEQSLLYIKKAIEISPNNKRLLNNLKLIKEANEN